MALFYGLAGLLTLLSMVLIVRPLLKGRGTSPSRAALDAQLYRDQLDEVERDLARGTIGAAEAEGARAEVSRRLLAATAQANADQPAAQASGTATGLVAGLALIGAPALAVVVYLSQGMPGQPDLPLAERLAAMETARPSQAQAEASFEPDLPEPTTQSQKDYVALIGQLESLIEQRPNDARGLELLANGYSQLGRHREAWRTYRSLVEVSGAQAPAELYGAMAEAMVMAAGGYVSPEAEQAIGKAMELNPHLPVVRYYAGLAAAQGGQMDEAIAIWERLKAESPADAPWMPFLDDLLAEARGMVGGTAPAPAPGPSAAEVEAAADLSPEERQQMIEGMVQRLEARLTSDGGEAEEWLRLITAYDRLGRREEAARVARLGIETFGSSTEADFLREQALLMGVLTE